MSFPASNVYNPNATYTQRSSAKWGLGSEKRKGLASTSLSPGPGGYSVDSIDFNPHKSKFHMG